MSRQKFSIKKYKGLVRRLTTPGDSLTEKTVKSGVWLVALKVTSRFFLFIRTIILARLLSPNDFGLFGIALLALSALDTFSQSGFNQALIQKKGDIESYLNTAWTVQVIRGLLLALILFVIAPYVAIFFESPAAEPIVKIIGLSVVLTSFTNIAVLYFEKELKFHKFFAYNFLGTIADVAVAITAAFLLRSVWALVFGLLAGSLVRCIVSYFIDSYRPRLRFNLVQAKELYNFGKWILGSSMLGFLVTQGDDIFVGKLLGVVTLGFYQMAYRISNMPAAEITYVISQVTFPAYSKIQDNISKLREAYLRVLQLTAFSSFLIAGLIFVLAPDFTKIFLGQKWMPIVPLMQVLVFASLVSSISATAAPIFNAVGEPKIETKWNIIRFSVMLVLIYPFTVKWGILGASIVVFLSAFVSAIGFIFNAIKIIECRLINFGKVVIFPLINGIIMVLSIFVVKTCVGTGILSFLLFIGMGVLVYLCITCLLDKYLNYGIKSLIKENLSSLR